MTFECMSYTPTTQSEECQTLVFSPAVEPYISIMKIVAEQNDLIYGDDIVGYDDGDLMLRAIYRNFTKDDRYVVGAVSFNDFERDRVYDVWANSTYDNCYQSTTYGYHQHRQEIEHAVANAINKMDIPDASPIGLTLRYNPALSESHSILHNEATYHVFVILGTGAIYLIYVSMCLISEKKNKMIEYLRTMGLLESANVLAYITTYSVFSLLPAILYELSGRILGTQLVADTPWGFPTVWFFLFLVGMTFVGTWIFTIVVKPSRIAIVIGCLLFVMAMNFSSYLEWIEDSSFPTYEEDGFFIQAFHMIDPSFAAFRTLAIVYYFIQKDGEFTWANVMDTVPSKSYRDMYQRGGVSYNFTVFLISYVFFYYLAWYYSYRSMGHKKCCFYLTKSFWFPKNIVKLEGTNSMDSDRNRSIDNQSIVFSYVTKNFDSCTAVKELRMEVKKNQLFTLLGPNGSGKTTSISMLTAVYPPTYGDIFVQGDSITEMTYDIQERTGICNQFDYFWPHFTPRQMFHVIGSFKGFSNTDIEEELKRLMNIFHLDAYINRDTETFSGGMKRKLSVALACMKGVDMIILDEPTSGMDPVSRLEVYNVLLELKKTKTILLTTHSMEEADLLSDEIGIMYMGRLRAIGSPIGLKQAYGKGYKVDVIINDKFDGSDIKEMFAKYMYNSSLIAESTGSISFGIDKKDMKILPLFLTSLCKLKSVKEWLISPSSLDEVFMRIVEMNRDVENADLLAQVAADQEKREAVHICKLCGTRVAEKITLYNKQGKAFEIDGIYCKHCASPTNTPENSDNEVEVAMTALTTKPEIEEQPEEADTENAEKAEQAEAKEPEPEEKPSKVVSEVKPVELVKSSDIIAALTWLQFSVFIKEKKRNIFILVITAIVVGLILFMGLFNFSAMERCPDGSLQYYQCEERIPVWRTVYTRVNAWRNYMAYQYLPYDLVGSDVTLHIAVDETGTSKSMRSLNYTEYFSAETGVSSYREGFVEFEFTDDLSTHMINKLTAMRDELVEQKTSTSTRYHNGVIIDLNLHGNATSEEKCFSLLNTRIPQFSLKVNEHEDKRLDLSLGMFNDYSSYTRGLCEGPYQSYVYTVNSVSTYYSSYIISFIDNAYHSAHSNAPNYFSSEMEIESRIYNENRLELISSFVHMCLSIYPLLFTVIIIFRMLSDNDSGRRAMLYLHNVSTGVYATSLFVYALLLMLGVVFICIVIFLGINIIPKHLIGTTILCFIVAAILCTTFSIFIGMVIHTKMLAVVISIVINALGYFLGELGVVYSFIPGYYLSMFLRGILTPDSSSENKIIYGSMLSLGYSVLFILLSYALFYLRYNIGEIIERKEQKKLASSGKLTEPLLDGTQMEDMDVMNERGIVEGMFDQVKSNNLNNMALVINKLTKYFPKDKGFKHVFDNISFGIRCNDVFGLLGPNGAGKTTLINILSGNMSANAGEFKIFGYTSNNRRIIRQLIGVVPQFDTFFDDMTVREHLILITKLHGIPRGKQLQVARNAAELIGLERDAFNMAAGSLSGGQKRRLTLGMSMVGKPHMVFLDEPTTGLDPESRREVWNTIKKMQETMTILVTTHSMEEADVLCSRIGILTNNGLQCFGSQVHLKNKYGKGFLFSFALNDCINDPDAFIKTELHKNFEFIEKKTSMLVYRVEKSTIDLGALLSKIFILQEKEMIVQWSISQSSLDDVFLRVCQDYERT